MAALVALPADDFFSEGYLDAFYRAHVASSRTRGSNNLDEDIAAIEAEIRKVQCYRSKFRSYRYGHQQQLNSCGNSECSDEDEVEDYSPTSVFKVYNSSSNDGNSSPLFHKTPDIFTWAAVQQVEHDHNYCLEPSTSGDTVIDHGTVNMKNIQWHQLTPTKRAHAIEKISCILQQKPSGRQSPTFSSLDLLPSSLANCIRKTGTLGLPSPGKDKSQNIHPCTNSHFQRLRQKTATMGHQQQLLPVTARPLTRNIARKKPSPYSKITRHINIEVTRVHNSSSCLEGEDPVIID